MALFGKKKAEETKQEAETKAPATRAARGPAPEKSGQPTDLSRVLLRPRITEKATDAMAARVYVFDVAEGANKTLVADAVEKVYKVKPAKIRIARVPHKVVRSPRTGMYGITKSGRKAYVYLKDGDSISIM